MKKTCRVCIGTVQGLWPVLVKREGETERFCSEPTRNKYVIDCNNSEGCLSNISRHESPKTFIILLLQRRNKVDVF